MRFPSGLNNEDVKAALSSPCRPTDYLRPWISTFHEIGDNSLELLGRQTLEGQHRCQRPPRLVSFYGEH